MVHGVPRCLSLRTVCLYGERKARLCSRHIPSELSTKEIFHFIGDLTVMRL